MPRIRSALAALLALCALAGGCRSDDLPQQPETTPVLDSQASPDLVLSADGPVTLKAQSESLVLTDADGTQLASVRFSYPKLVGSTQGIAAVNALLKQELQDYLDSASGRWLADAQQARAALGQQFASYTIESTYEATYNSAGLLCLLRTEYGNLGAAYPTLGRSSRTFLVTTGQELSAADLLQKDLNQLLVEQFTALIQAQPDSYSPDALSLLEQGAGQGGFYLSHSELRLYLPTDLIAPRAAGFPECSISYAENDCFRVDIPRVDLDAQPLKTAMKEIYEQVVPLLPEEERTDVRMVSEGEGEVEGEAVYIVQLYLPEGQVIGYYAVGQQSGDLYQRDDQGVFQPWEP